MTESVTSTLSGYSVNTVVLETGVDNNEINIDETFRNLNCVGLVIVMNTHSLARTTVTTS